MSPLGGYARGHGKHNNNRRLSCHIPYIPYVPYVPETTQKEAVMKRPELHEIDLSKAMGNILNAVPGVVVTLSPKQWDKLLQAAYDGGATLLEIGKHERPVKAYRRKVDA
jgi:hypothetical protein